MLKKLVLLSVLLGTSIATHGAVLIYSDDFDSYTPGTEPTGWTRVDIFNNLDHANRGVTANGDGTDGAVIPSYGGANYLNAGASTVYSRQVTASMEYFNFYELSVYARNSGTTDNGLGRIYFTDALQSEVGGVLQETALLGQETAITGSDEWVLYKVGFRVGGSNAALVGQPLFINLESNANDAGFDNTLGFDEVRVERSVPEPGAAVMALFGMILLGGFRKFRGAAIQ